MSPWRDYPASRPIAVEGGIKARSKRGAIGEQWWSRRFIAFLESSGMSGRLQRGRSYARRGQVLEFSVRAGKVTARVQGSRPQPYQVSITVRPLTVAQSVSAISATFGGVDRETLVYQEFPQGGPASRRPVVVIPALLGDQPLELAPAGRRGIANRVSHLMRHPKWQQLRRQSHSIGLGIGPPGEMLQADEDRTPPTDHEFPRVCGTHAHHQVHIGGTVYLKQVLRLGDGVFHNAFDVG